MELILIVNLNNSHESVKLCNSATDTFPTVPKMLNVHRLENIKYRLDNKIHREQIR